MYEMAKHSRVEDKAAGRAGNRADKPVSTPTVQLLSYLSELLSNIAWACSVDACKLTHAQVI